MVYKEHSGLIVIRLDDGETFPDELKSIFDDIPYMESGVVLSALGMLSDFELGYFRDGEYHRDRFDVPMELIAISGSISRNAEPWFHFHAALANEDKSVVGGHLFRGRVWGTLEIFLLSSGLKLYRVPKGHLKVLDII